MSAFKTWLTGLTSKTTPVDADETYLRDSEDSGASKKLTWVNIKATLKTYFDGLYLALTGGTVAGGTRTTSGSTLTITETLNNAAVTFPGALVINQTHTASNAASKIFDLQVGGATRLNVRKDGTIFGDADTSIAMGGGFLTYKSYGTNALYMGGTALVLGLNGTNTASITLSHAVGTGTVITSDASNTLAQRNGTNAQTFRLYGTYTDASNYRRLALAMTTAGVASLAPEGAGTGASGNVLHISGLPTSNPGAGILWNDAGTVKVGT